jgi:hypothetical protein
MSREELVTAYLDGRLSRRTLIRRLVAAGVSVGAAVSYAHLLHPERAHARPDNDLYPDATARLVVEKLTKVVNRERIIVRMRADEDSELRDVRFRLYRLKQGVPFDNLGQRIVPRFNGPDVKEFEVPLSPQGVQVLTGRSRARIALHWVASDRDGKHPNGISSARFEA